MSLSNWVYHKKLSPPMSEGEDNFTDTESVYVYTASSGNTYPGISGNTEPAESLNLPPAFSIYL